MACSLVTAIFVSKRIGLLQLYRPMEHDHYADLGLAKGATQAEIKSSYRKLVIEHHPDKQGDPVKFRAVAGAYAVLGDPAKREAYDFAQKNARVVDLKAESTALVEEYFRQFKPQYQ